MTDPRKSIRRPGGEEGNVVRDIIHAFLLRATHDGASAIGCTGASFVVSGIGIWAVELSDLDPAAARDFMHAIGDLIDPKANPIKKQHAERRRRAAVAKLLAAVDLDMNPPQGNA